MAKIAFIGLGHMGGGMAPNLAKAGHDVRAFDLSEEALAAAKAAYIDARHKLAAADTAAGGAKAAVATATELAATAAAALVGRSPNTSV